MSECKDLPVTVDRDIPVTFDLGNLAVFDGNALDGNLLDSSDAKREETIKALARDNVQLLINQLLSLPVQTSKSGVAQAPTLLRLPDPSTELPREKPLPKPKEPTKWELFARRKGIKAKPKQGKLVYDQSSGEWAPKWGFKGANKKLDDQWLVEVDDRPKKSSQDDLIDPRTVNRAERKRLVKKNERQQKKNLQRASNQ